MREITSTGSLSTAKKAKSTGWRIDKLLRASLLGVLILSGCNQFGALPDGGVKLVTTNPLAPTGFTIGTLTDTSISFSWTNNATDGLINTVEMCTGTGCTNFTEVSRSPYGPTATTHEEDGLTANTIYRFRIKSTSISGTSDYLTSGDINTLLTASTSISLTSVTATSITIGFNFTAASATGVEIQRCSGVGCTSYAAVSASPIAAGSTTFTETGLTEGSTYRLRARVTTSGETSGWVTSSDITTLAATPSNIVTTVLSSSAVDLGWDDNSSAETGYETQRCVGSACDFSTNTSTSLGAGVVVSHVTGLAGNTTYRFRVRAVKATGNSAWLTSGDVTTLPAAPAALTATSVTDTTISLSWTNPNAGTLDFYDLESCTGSSCSSFATVAGSPLAGTALTYTATGLSVSTLYSFRIRAHKGSNISPYSARLDTSTAATAPAAPTALVVGTVTQSSIQISWTDNATDEDGYQVESCTGTGCTSFVAVSASPLAANSTTDTETSLSPGTIYRFRVRAHRAGDGSVSTDLVSGDIKTVVAAPTALVASSVSDTTTNLSWADNATGELQYEIQSCTGSGCSSWGTSTVIAPNSTSYAVTGLTATTFYSYRVRATSADGPSAWATVADVKTAPAAPSSLVTGTVTATSIQISWTDNASDETAFQVQKCAGSGCTSFSDLSVSPMAANSATVTESGLTASTTYRFRVRAYRTTTAVSSAWLTSGDIKSSIAAPTGITISAISDTGMTVNWVDSANEDHYEIQSCSGSACSSFAALASTVSGANTIIYAATGLTPSTLYSFRVRGIASDGTPSPWLSVADTKTASAAPSTYVAGTATATSLQFTYADNSSDETGFEVQRCTGTGCNSGWVATNAANAAANATTFTETGLSAGTVYRFRIRALRAGDSTTSAWYTPGVDFKTLITAPSGLTITSISDTGMTVNWVDSSGEDHYDIQSCSGTACSSWAALASTVSGANTIAYTATGLTPSTNYSFRVRGIAADGSASAWLTQADTKTAPAAPSGIMSGTLAQTSIQVLWTDNASDEDGFQVEKCAGTGCTSFAPVASSPIATANLATYTESGLAPYSIYRFRVRAYRAAVQSAWVTSGDIKTLIQAPTAFTVTSKSDTSIGFSWADNASGELFYDIQRCTGVACASLAFGSTGGTTQPANTTSYTATGLSPSTSYEYRIRAAAPDGTFSAWLTSGDNLTSPAAPTSIVTGTVTATSIQINWTENGTDEDAVNGIEVQRCAGSGCDFSVNTSTLAAQNTATLTTAGLTANTTYRFRVRDVRSTDTSNWLTSGDITTLIAAPTGLVINTITDTSMAVNWTDSANEDHFEIQTCTGASCSSWSALASTVSGANTTSYSATGLTASTIYNFRVRGIKADGTPSAWLSSTDTTTAPAAPSTFTWTAAGSTINSIQFGFADNATAETGYEVQRCLGSGCSSGWSASNAANAAANATTFTETGLTSNTTYRFRIRALRAGDSTASNWYTPGVDVKTLIDAPTAAVASNITDTSFTVGWSDSAAEDHYEIQSCTGTGCSSWAGVASTISGANTVSYAASGLSASTNYSFRVRGVATDGTTSAWLTLVNTKTAPAAPTSFVVGAATSSSLAFTYADNASDETSYEVQKCQGSGCNSGFIAVTAANPAANATSFTETGLASSTVFRFRIRAVRSSDSTTSNWLTSTTDQTTSAAAVAAASCASPKTVVIDKGLKANLAALARGTYSDTRIINAPSGLAGKPAVAYTDYSATGGSGNIKISYWDGSKFNVEQVAATQMAAATAPTFVKLGFLGVAPNAGRPMVFWTDGGTHVYGAMRSAALGSTGTWATALLETVSTTAPATRALSIAVSPADDVAVVYVQNNAATASQSAPKFIYCGAGSTVTGSGCSSITSGWNTMTTQTDGINATAAAGAGSIQMGVAWCKNTAGTKYLPAVVFNDFAATAAKYAVCTGAIATCITNAGWTKTTVATVAAATTIISDLYIDPTVNGDTNVSVLFKPTAAIALTTAKLTTGGCDAATTFTANGTLASAAGDGTSFARLMKDTVNGLWHVVANTSTTSIGYNNSTTNRLDTTAWNTVGALTPIETATVGATGAWSGGADISNANGVIYASYGVAGAPFNLNLGIVSDFTQPSNGAFQSFYTVYPDNSGAIQLPLVAGPTQRNVSTAMTNTNLPGVAYVDYSTGVTGAAGTGRLKYAYRNGSTYNTAWTVQIIPNTMSPAFPSLAFDNNNLPWISYYDQTNFRYYVATNSSSDGSGTWTQITLPIGAKAASAAAPATDDTAMAMYYSGGVAYPVVIYLSSVAGAGVVGVHSVKINPTTMAASQPNIFDTLGASFAERLSADFDTSGNIVVAYFDLTTTTVKFNYTTNGGIGTTGGGFSGGWRTTPAQISTALTGRQGLSIKLNPATGRPAVSYYNLTTPGVYYNYCTTALSSCANAANWTQNAITTTAVGVNGGGVNIGTIGANSTAFEQLFNTSLSFAANGDPYVAYATGVTPTGVSAGLTVATSSLANSFGSGISSAPLAVNAGISATVTPVSNSYGQMGLNVSGYRNALGNMVNIHVGENDWLYATSCGE